MLSLQVVNLQLVEIKLNQKSSKGKSPKRTFTNQRKESPNVIHLAVTFSACCKDKLLRYVTENNNNNNNILLQSMLSFTLELKMFLYIYSLTTQGNGNIHSIISIYVQIDNLGCNVDIIRKLTFAKLVERIKIRFVERGTFKCKLHREKISLIIPALGMLLMMKRSTF